MAPTAGAECFCPSRKLSQPEISEATRKAPAATASQKGHVSDWRGASRTRSGSNARRRRSGPNEAPMNTRKPHTATTNTASPSARANLERELMPSARAAATLSATSTAERSSATELARIRRHASPISLSASVRMAAMIEDSARNPPARAGASARIAATPATAYGLGVVRKPLISTAHATAAAADPVSTRIRRGSLPTSASSDAATAETAAAATQICKSCGLEATKIGIRRNSTTIATTDQVACTIAIAAGGAVTAVWVSQEPSGQSASRPPVPRKRSTDATTSDRTVHPGLVCRMGSSAPRFCTP